MPSDLADKENPEKMVYHVPKPRQYHPLSQRTPEGATVPPGYCGPMPGTNECLPVPRVSISGEGVGGGGLDVCDRGFGNHIYPAI